MAASAALAFVVWAQVAKADSEVTGAVTAQQVGTAAPANDLDAPAADASGTAAEEVVGDDDPPLDVGADPSSNAQSAQSEAISAQTGSANENVSVRVDQARSSGAVEQTNDVSATAASSVDGSWGSGSPPADDPHASASATSTQTAPSNGNIAVRVGSPGDVGDVRQSNGSFAGAKASGTTGAGAVGTKGAANGGTSGRGSAGTRNRADAASAVATQTSPSNVNVVVRVDSPGDNGTVDQDNTVTAAAGSSIPASPGTKGGPRAPDGPRGTDQKVTTTGSASASNDGELIQQIAQTDDAEGRPGEAARPGASSAQANGSANGAAAASQSGALNANVSVRVGSPGSDGAVHQANGATAAGTGPHMSAVSVTGSSNLNVTVVLPGSPGARDGAWTWSWEWDGAWTPPPAAGEELAPTATSVWDWTWQTAESRAAATASATADVPYGTWTWSWTWLLPDGSTRQLTWKEACECAWAWNWTWDWSKQAPASVVLPAVAAAALTAAIDAGDAARTLDPATDDGTVAQSNAVGAEATAAVELSTRSTVTTTGGQDSSADQRVWSSQTGRALSGATQEDSWNLYLVWGVPVESVLQSNEVDALTTATVTARISQAIVQEQKGDGSTEQSAEAVQSVDNTQAAVAVARSAQATARNVDHVSASSRKDATVGTVEQSNRASSNAVSTIDAEIAQWIDQFQDSGVATVEDARATQLHVNLQDALAVSRVAQVRTANVDDVAVPPAGSAANPASRQANEVFVTTAALGSSAIDGWIHQVQGGGAEFELAEAHQTGIVTQTNTASAVASQSDLLNHAAWAGVEPSDEAPVDSGAADGEIEQPTRAAAGQADGTTAGRSDRAATAPALPARASRADEGTLDVHADSRDTGEYVPHDEPHGSETGSLVPTRGADWAVTSGAAAGSTKAPNGAASGASAPPAPLHPSSDTGASAPPREAESLPPRSSRRAHDSPPPVGGGESSGAGASTTAPPAGGGGPAASALGRYELAAPEGLGLRLSTPIPGRSGASVEPFERPG